MTTFTEKDIKISAKYKKYKYYDSNSVRREIEYKHEQFGKIHVKGININNPQNRGYFWSHSSLSVFFKFYYNIYFFWYIKVQQKKF